MRNLLVDILEVFWWNFGKIARKFWKNLIENEKKISNYFRKIMEILLGKTEVIWNWCCWYYGEILRSLSEIIKTYEEILEELWKFIGNTSHKLKKNFDGGLGEIFKAIFGRTYEKLYGNFK